jgi:hypothetical protein
VEITLSPCFLPLHFPMCLRVSLRQRDTTGNNGARQSLDNFMIGLRALTGMRIIAPVGPFSVSNRGMVGGGN